MPVAGKTKLTDCTVDNSLRMWTAEGARDLGEADVHRLSTFPQPRFVHSCTTVDQRVCLNHPQAYTQDASLAPPGAGVIGACSHAGPGILRSGRQPASLPSRSVKHQRAGQALVSFLVSFSYVRPGSPGHSRPCRRRSQTVTTRGEHGPTDLESVLEPAVTHDRHHRPHTRRACGPGGGRPGAARPGWEPSEPQRGSAVLTDLLTTALDHHGRRRTEKPREQGRCDSLDSCGRF